MTTPAEVVARRRADRQALIAQAQTFVEEANNAFELRAAVVFGSVARGDWNDASDVDVLVIVDGLPSAPLARLAAVAAAPGRVAPVLWSVDEWHREHHRRNPIIVEALDHGLWLHGSPAALSD